jgi:hypothetical protein
VAYGIGFAVLVLVAFTGGFAASLVTVTHEGGHMAMGLLTGAGVTSFTLTDKPGRMEGATRLTRPLNLSVSNIMTGVAGYAMPPLMGLGGAYVVADGNSWGVLWIGIVLLAAVLLTKTNGLARLATLDPLRDHRPGHPRPLDQQRPHLRLVGIGDRAPRHALVARWPVRAQRRPHRVPRNPEPPDDLLDRHALSPMQATDLCPVLQRESPPPALAQLSEVQGNRAGDGRLRAGQRRSGVTGRVVRR